MKTKLMPLTVVVVALLLVALSTGGKIFFLLAVLLVLLMASAYLAVWQAGKSIEVTNVMTEQTVTRGDHAMLQVSITYHSWIPVAPITLHLSGAMDYEQKHLRLRDTTGRAQRIQFPFDAMHVGVMTPGIDSFEIEDMFGLVTLIKKPEEKSRELMVLPQIFDVQDLKFAPGDSGFDSTARATEDVNMPAEVRAYQPGDPLKKIHWKLSARKGSLLVRRFEEPTHPDALVLLDCSPPYASRPEEKAYVKDTLLETAASVVAHHIRSDHPIRLPLLGAHPIEFEKSMGLQALMEELARLDFSQTERFERVLQLETRRMRKTGATVVITSRLNSNIVDMIVRMRRMGPYVRLYFVTFTPDDPQLLPLIGKLQHNTVEVCYVTPAV